MPPPDDKVGSLTKSRNVLLPAKQDESRKRLQTKLQPANKELIKSQNNTVVSEFQRHTAVDSPPNLFNKVC